MTDHGGDFRPYLDRGQLVEIRGTCESACTLWLGLPTDRLCVASHAWLGFHRAAAKSATMADMGTQAMWLGYSAPLHARLGRLTDDMVYLRGRDLIAMGYRECGK
jgi:hypothetical protein